MSTQLGMTIGCQEYAAAKLNPVMIQIEVVTQSSTDLTIICRDLCGNPLATVMLQQGEDNRETLRKKIEKAVHPPFGPASLYIVLPCTLPGRQFLRDVTPQTPLREALCVTQVEVSGYAKSARGFTVFKIDVHKDERSWSVYRRYNHFAALSKKSPCEVALPSKSFFRKALMPGFIDKRQKKLDKFLRARVLQDPNLMGDLKDFLSRTS